MNIFNEGQLYQYFKDAINRAISSEVSEIKGEIQKLQHEAYQKVLQDFEQRKNENMKAIEEHLNLEYQKNLSRLEQALNRSLALYREELVISLIDKLILQYKEYQKTEKYLQKIQLDIAKLDSKLVENIEVSSFDFGRIKEYKDIKIVENSTITAGYRVYFKDGKSLLDETLEAKIVSVTEWFYNHATLDIFSEM